MNSLDWVSKWASYTPDKKAVVSLDTGEIYTYKRLHEVGLQLGSYLVKHYRLKKGNRVAVLAEHSPEYLMLFIAAQRLGLILVPLNYRATSGELLYCMGDVAASLLITDHESFKQVTAELESRLPNTIVVSMKSLFSGAGSIKMPAIISEFKIEQEQPVFIFYTSGTTGKPRGVIYTNRMLFWNSLNTGMQLEITSRDHTVNALPPYHTSGWNVLLLPMLHCGASIAFTRKFRAGKMLRFLQEPSVTLFLAVPTMLRMMIKQKAFERFKAKNLKYIVVGGEPLSNAVIEAWAGKGVLLSQGYGLTEAGPSITSLHYHDSLWKKGSIGKPNFYIEIKIVDEEGRETADGISGELCLRGNVVTPGYWNDMPGTMEKIRDNWLHTGDIVRRDREGFLYVVGRKNQSYISGGENIHPLEVEAVLNAYDPILEAAVIGVEHEEWGETGIAFIVLKRIDTGLEEIIAHLKKQLASYKIPKDFVFLDALPKSGIGKINRKELKELYKRTKDEQRDIV